jgi:NitT/TauT family transport system ATP-binding protein
MPAKGVDVIDIEAPAKEPLALGEVAGQRGDALALSAVWKRFSGRQGPVTALAGVGFTAHPNEVVGIVGPSGCGKSTMLELVAGLDDPTGGEIAVGGETDAAERLRRCVLMHQRDLLFPWRSALDNAALALEVVGISRADARRRVEPMFERFGLGGFARSRPFELSGGMRQRVAFLRTLLAGKPVLLLDEPFGLLDSITRADMQEWLAGALLEEPRTVLLVSHDVEEALFLCDRVLFLSSRPGRVTSELDVDIPRPRPRLQTVTSQKFVRLKQRALEALG